MRTKIFFTLAWLLLGTAWVVQAEKRNRVLWVDYDFKSIPEPKPRGIGYYDSFFSSEMAEQWKRGLDIPRWVRLGSGSPKQASNVNALDEVPDSSWYTNRHALRHMTIDQLVQGPNRGEPPDFSHATITKAKLEGVTPGIQLTDNRGESYLIKFDNKNYPELQSGAEVISTKILYAAGYNVPQNYIGTIDPAKLEIKPGVEIADGGKKHPFTAQDLTKMLQNAAQKPNGTYRVLASKILKGTQKGPFPHIGIRRDDPNDIIPHEHRRDLRGLRVIASWINHWDLKEQNTLDMYVSEGGRQFLRHYLIDFGSSLGGGKSPKEYLHGREYAFDRVNLFKEVFTLGFYVTPDEKSASIIYPQVGIFSSADFDPGDWKTSFHMMAFDNMTHEDALWGTRIILSFTREELQAIVRTAEYSNPMAAEYVLTTLLARRQQIATYWLKDANPISDFAVEANGDGISLKFNDLLAENEFAGPAGYRYEVETRDQEIRKERRHSDQQTTSARRIFLGRSLAGETRVRIWTIRDNASTAPVMVSVQNNPGGGYGIFRIDRL